MGSLFVAVTETLPDSDAPHQPTYYVGIKLVFDALQIVRSRHLFSKVGIVGMFKSFHKVYCGMI